jgi:lysyl-tRNA synthetase class 2
MAVDLRTSADRTSLEAEPAAHKPSRIGIRDDRWPDRLATAMFVFSALVVVATFIPPLRRYFRQWHDIVSMLTIPIVPNLVYAALLIAVGIALRRRLRAAWWIFVIWWIILPQLGRIFSIISGGPLIPQIVGFVIMSAVFVVLLRAKPQFQARGRARNLLAAIICFVVGVVLILIIGTWLVNTFGYSG